LPARNVLGGEASDFTPWLHLQDNLDVLGRALGLDDLTAGSTEHNVLGKRLDILASATDEDGQEVPVCIENQYGTSDASHLGRLVAYLAQQERGGPSGSSSGRTTPSPPPSASSIGHRRPRSATTSSRCALPMARPAATRCT
jgi:hypothetical protein